MKKNAPTPNPHLARHFAVAKFYNISSLILMLAALPSAVFADATWVGGTSQNWNTTANWSTTPAGTLTVNTSTGNYPTLSATPTVIPNDFNLGLGSGNSGRFDQSSGTLAQAVTGIHGNWMFVGVNTGAGAYNLSGNGSLVVGKLWVGGTVYNENGNGTVTINTTGSLNAQSTDDFSGWGQYPASILIGWGHSPVGTGNGTLNLINGTIYSTNDPIYVGTWGSSGLLNQSGGTINAAGLSLARWFSDDSGDTITNLAAVVVSNGVLNTAWVDIGRTGNNTDISRAALTVNSNGIVNSEGDFDISCGGGSSSTSAVNINAGGTLNIASTTKRWMVVGQYDYNSATVNINGGTVNLNANTDLRFSTSGNNGANVVNLNSGVIASWSGNQTGAGAGVVDLNQAGGSGANNTFNLNGGTLTVAQVIANQSGGTSVFNFNGGTLKPTGSSSSFVQNLSAANVQSGGAIINSAGFNITIAQTLADAGGGLTKTGNGTLTLGGGFGYSGPTLVQGGTLSLDAAQSSSASALTVSNAALSLSLNNGNSSLSAGNITLTGTNVLNFNFGTATGPTGNPAINASGYAVSNTGTNIINITGQYLTVGQYPLIYTGGSVPTNNFVLGTKPTGVIAVLTNSGLSLDLLVTGSGQTLIWNGADNSGNPLTTWNINSSLNWNSGTAKYLQYSGNSYGDNVTFDDTAYNSSDANITLNTAVVPASVLFNNSSYSYSLTGSGGIGGSTPVAMTGSGSTYLGTTNTYTGGTTISAGTLSVVNDSALGAHTSPVALNGGVLQFNNNSTSSRSITVNSNSTITVATGANAQLSGTVYGGAKLTGNGPGSLTLAGSDTTLAVIVGGAAGNSVMNLSGTLTTSNLFLGNSSGAVGAVYQTGGTVTAGGGGGDCLNVGNLAGSFGYYNAQAGTLTASGVSVGGENNAGSGPSGTGGDGIMEINGGAVNDTGWLVMSRGASTENGILNVFSGSLTWAGGGLVCNWGSGQTAILNIQGGSLSSTTTGIGLGGSGNTGILNLNGGVLAAQSVGGNWGGTYGQLNFNGGTLQAVANMANPLRLTSATVYANGATIDDGGYTVSLDQPLLAPAGYGSSSIVLSDGGSGFVAPPVVTISGGSGSNATAIAQINVAAGTITNILVTCPGSGYSSSDTLTVNFNDIGGATAPATATVNLVANTSGGLVKKGAGTLTLAGANTYTGTTVVSNGMLWVAGPPVLHLSFDNVNGTNVINDGTGGSAMNGSLYGAGATIVPGGQFGNCLSISGANASSSSCRIASSVVPLTVGSGSSWTVSMWVQSSTAGGCYAYQGDGGWGWGNSVFYLNSDGTTAGTKAGGVRWGQGWETGSTGVNDGNWHHVVLTYNGNVKTSYVDGNPDALTTDQWGSTGTGGQFWIGGGADTGDGTANLNGLVDEVYVFDRAISPAEVQSLYSYNSLPGTAVVPGAVTVAPGAALGGNGIVGGPVTVQPAGAISVGAAIGTLTINSNLTLAGNVSAAVNTSVAPSNSVIAVSGSLTNTGTGTLTLNNIGPALAAGNSFKLFSKALASGNAMTVNTTPALASGLVLSNRLSLDGSVLVVSTGPGTFTTSPAIGTMSLSGGNVVITGTGGQAGDAYYLLASTNVALPLNEWQTVATNVLSTGGNFTFTGTNAVAAGSQQQFYILSNTNYNH